MDEYVDDEACVVYEVVKGSRTVYPEIPWTKRDERVVKMFGTKDEAVNFIKQEIVKLRESTVTNRFHGSDIYNLDRLGEDRRCARFDLYGEHCTTIYMYYFENDLSLPTDEEYYNVE